MLDSFQDGALDQKPNMHLDILRSNIHKMMVQNLVVQMAMMMDLLKELTKAVEWREQKTVMSTGMAMEALLDCKLVDFHLETH